MLLKDIIPGRYYKYKGKWGHCFLFENVLHLNPTGNVEWKINWFTKVPYDEEEKEPYRLTEEIASEITEEWGQKINDEIDFSQAMKEFHNQPLEFYGPSVRKAKEIALEAASKIGYAANADMLLEEADKIYQWLIK